MSEYAGVRKAKADAFASISSKLVRLQELESFLQWMKGNIMPQLTISANHLPVTKIEIELQRRIKLLVDEIEMLWLMIQEEDE